MTETLGVKNFVPARQFSFYRTVRMAARSVIFMLCLMLAIVSATIAADDAYIAG